MKKNLLSFLLSLIISLSISEQDFDVRQHLSTVSRYGAVKHIAHNHFIPQGCVPIHLNLVARHGTRSPTKKRIKELANFSVRVEVLIRDAKERNLPMERVPSWLHEWISPWQGWLKGGELISKGEEELYELGIRIREMFPNLFEEEYHPDIYHIKATQVTCLADSYAGDAYVRAGVFPCDTLSRFMCRRFTCQSWGVTLKRRLFNDMLNEFMCRSCPCQSWGVTEVPRASASAVAFGMGLFSNNGSLGPGQHRAFAVTSESRASDIVLRFHDCCHNYKDFRKRKGPEVDKLKEPILDEITTTLVGRYGLNFTRQDTSTLWFLCKQEASLLDITNQACSLFTPSEVLLLEWTDDLEVFILKGYGNSINYRMGIPLLEDVVLSMEQAIKAEEERHPPGSFEKARLRFAHAETVLPFSCLLGLFLEKSEFEKIQKEQPLQLPPKPPLKRKWRASIVSPFAGNIMLVLYSCPANNNSTSKHFVQVLHNEHPIPMLGCDGSDLCSFEVFKEKIVAPHKKHDYDTVCNAKLEPKLTGRKFTQIFQWLLRKDMSTY